MDFMASSNDSNNNNKTEFKIKKKSFYRFTSQITYFSYFYIII